MPADRYVVVHALEGEDEQVVPFARKGLAFAYAKRKLKLIDTLDRCVAVQFQVEEGAGWVALDTWKFFYNGDIDHIAH